jgi:6-phosphogluconate dehydrogenase
MAHNGIEYGIMQLISEVYDLMKRGYNLDDNTIQKVFEDWNDTELQSYLIEITGQILKKQIPTARSKCRIRLGQI